MLSERFLHSIVDTTARDRHALFFPPEHHIPKPCYSFYRMLSVSMQSLFPGLHLDCPEFIFLKAKPSNIIDLPHPTCVTWSLKTQLLPSSVKTTVSKTWYQNIKRGVNLSSYLFFLKYSYTDMLSLLKLYIMFVVGYLKSSSLNTDKSWLVFKSLFEAFAHGPGYCYFDKSFLLLPTIVLRNCS